MMHGLANPKCHKIVSWGWETCYAFTNSYVTCADLFVSLYVFVTTYF
jgi:hypothetical protein